MTSLTRHLEQLQAEIQKRGPASEVLGVPAFPLAYELSLAIQMVKARIDESLLQTPTLVVWNGRALDAEALAQTIADGLEVQHEADVAGAPYVSKWNQLSDITVDGDVDLVALAKFIIERAA